MANGPIIEIVLSEPQSYPNAEEGRLFYVTITRGRYEIHHLTSEAEPSSFAEELRGYDCQGAFSARFSVYAGQYAVLN